MEDLKEILGDKFKYYESGMINFNYYIDNNVMEGLQLPLRNNIWDFVSRENTYNYTHNRILRDIFYRHLYLNCIIKREWVNCSSHRKHKFPYD